jgi:hypothetical protein
MIRRKFVVIAIVGAAYAIAGVVSAALAGAASTVPARNAWRLAAWGACAIIFAAHLWYELYKLEQSPRLTARYASNGVEIGALLLAVAAYVHSLSLPPSARGSNVAWALIVWPVMLGIVSFLAAWVVSAVLARLRPVSPGPSSA